ncbi:MAG: hypothetical protein IKU54_04905 [Oscillospiraceae bacterium]|nr:hypothetical protein [Oscillospiraceae bacterium]
MEYYFYSSEIGLRGAVNYKRIKASLADTKEKAVELAQRNNGVSQDNPVGFIYSCRVMDINRPGQSINNAYKSDLPVVITGCEYLENIYAEIEENKNCAMSSDNIIIPQEKVKTDTENEK